MKSRCRLLLACILAVVAQTGFARAQAPSDGLKAEALNQLVAPIALYPDALLSEILMASTYPLEVVEADRWVSGNKELKGDALKSAVDKQSWDDSVKSLTATPPVLSMMSGKLDWTQKLGDAVLAQQVDVMDAIQNLRSKAQAQNKLTSTRQQTVSTKQDQGRQTIVIEPAQPDVIYVPYYDPAVVYGAWAYPDYPPYYWAVPGYIPGAAIGTGMAFAAGFAVGAWATHGNYWGGGVNWGGNAINVNRPININNSTINNWTHNPDHRHGVAYNNANTANKFSSNNFRNNAQDRIDFRGRDGQQVVRPGGDRASLGPRDGANRSTAGDRRPGSRDAGANTRDRGGANARNRPSGARPPGSFAGRGGHDSAFAGAGSGRFSNAAAARGHASLRGGGGRVGGGGGGRFTGGGRSGGGGFHGGGGRGRR